MSRNAANWSAREQFWAGLLATGVVGATLWPLVQYRRPAEQRVDGFPLSYYPMFSPKRGQHGDVSYAVGVRRDGTRFNLPSQVLGTGGVNQVRKQLSRALRRNRVEHHAGVLAARLAESPEHLDVVRVEIVRSTFDFDAYMLEGAEPTQTQVLGGADVPRGPAVAVLPQGDRPEGIAS